MIGWHQQLDGHELEQALGVGDGEGSLVYCSPWGCKELDITLATELNFLFHNVYFSNDSYAYHPLMRMNLATVNLTLISFDKLYHSSKLRILSVQKALILNFTLFIFWKYLFIWLCWVLVVECRFSCPTACENLVS